MARPELFRRNQLIEAPARLDPLEEKQASYKRNLQPAATQCFVDLMMANFLDNRVIFCFKDGKRNVVLLALGL